MNDFKYSIVEERKASFADAKFYKEVAKKAKDFGIMGKNSIMNGIYVNEAQGSHFWFACLSDQIAREQGSRLITLEDAGLILKKENFIKGFYCEFNQLNLFSNKAIFEKNQPLIDYLSGELKNLGYEFSPENPISIKGAKILEDKNKK
ncbi:MAG: hypothetical protein U9Q99_00470, partial [Nanoarchaeota archaeon]|nr:hypothetical protein [Nanoarchaeota archaeon]